MEMNEKIKNRREELGLTLQEIGEFLGVSKATVQRYESGEIKNLKLETIEKLAIILKVSPAYLMGWEDKKDEKHFTTVEEATSYLIKLPSMAAYGGYDINKMSNEEIIDFANELLHQFELISHKYKK